MCFLSSLQLKTNLVFQDKWFFFNVSFLAVLGLCCHSLFSSWSKPGPFSSCGVWASHSGGFSCGAKAQGCSGFSSCGSWAVEHRLNCSAFMWDLSRSGIEPVSPALAGRFSTTEAHTPYNWCSATREVTALRIPRTSTRAKPAQQRPSIAKEKNPSPYLHFHSILTSVCHCRWAAAAVVEFPLSPPHAP